MFRTPPPRRFRRGEDGIFGEALAEDGLIFFGPGLDLNSGGGSVAFFLGKGGAVHSQEQAKHGLGPHLVLNLEEKDELTQEVGVAEAVKAVQLKTGAEAVVDEAAREPGENREMPDGIHAAPAAEAIPREEPGAGDMEPMKFSGHTEAGFIGVDDGGPG